MYKCQLKLTQQGAGLVDALISVVLVSGLALGILYATTTAERGHRDIKLNNLVLTQMREILQSNKFPDPNDSTIPPTTYVTLYNANTKKCYSNSSEVSSTPITVSLHQAIRINFGGTTTNKTFDLNAICILVNNSTLSIKLTTIESDKDKFGGILEVGNDN